MDKRIICLVGTDFCGSTILSRFFWQVPGVVAPGEIHALGKGYSGCDLCKTDCPILGKKAPRMDYDELTYKNLYARVYKAFSPGRAMVVSDKALRVYRRTVQSKSAEALILFRAPWSHGMSEVVRRRRTWKGAMAYWEGRYQSALRFKRFSRVRAVSFERLVSDPDRYMKRLCKVLGLPAPRPIPKNLDDIRWHHVGGSRRGRLTKEVMPDIASIEKRKVPPRVEKLHNQLLALDVLKG